MIKPTDPTKDTANSDLYKTVTRTINVTGPDGTKTSTIQTVSLGCTKTWNATTNKYDYSDWSVLDTSEAKSWAEYKIPEVSGYVSKIVENGQDKYITSVPEVTDFAKDPKDVTIDVTYVKAETTEKATDHQGDSDYWHKVTRTINFKSLTDGFSHDPVVQTVTYSRNKIVIINADGTKDSKWTEWETDDTPTWAEYDIPQMSYYHTEVDGQRQIIIPSVNVSETTADQTLTVSYVSDGTDPYNQQVVPGLKGNWAYIESIGVTDGGLHVSGWNANSDSYNRNYHYIIILDYGQNPVKGQYHELGRILVQNPTLRPDVFKVHPVWNAAESGFNVTVPLDVNAIHTGDKLRVLSRWTSDPNGNNDTADLWGTYYTMDYNLNRANLDNFSITSDGKSLEASGWNATNQVVGRPYHYVILYDATTGHEIERQLVKDGIERQDVANAYQDTLNASKSGFDVKFDLTNVDLVHNLQIISRYSDSANGEGNHVDYWFGTKKFMTKSTSNFGNLDGVTFGKDAKTGKPTITFTGWNANNYSTLEPNRFMILFDTTANQQVASTKITGVERKDVQNAYKWVDGSLNSGYNITFDASDLTPGHTYALVSRYSSSADGNGNDGAHTDYWFNNALVLNQKAYCVDDFHWLTNDDKTITVHANGWMADDESLTHPNQLVILMDAKTGKEITRATSTAISRPDVQTAYSHIANADMSGFSADFKLNADQTKQAKDDGVYLIMRYYANPTQKGEDTQDSNYSDQDSQHYTLNASNEKKAENSDSTKDNSKSDTTDTSKTDDKKTNSEDKNKASDKGNKTDTKNDAATNKNK